MVIVEVVMPRKKQALKWQREKGFVFVTDRSKHFVRHKVHVKVKHWLVDIKNADWLVKMKSD